MIRHKKCFPTDGIYRSAYTNLPVRTPIKGDLTIQALSKPNLVLAPDTGTDRSVKPKISSLFAGSNVTSFDMQSVAYGCTLVLPNGLIVYPSTCTIRFVGVKAGSGDTVSLDAEFDLETSQARFATKVQRMMFPQTFKELTSLEASILSSDGQSGFDNTTVEMAFDDFFYTVHFREET
jgi:hypothetical protein